MEDHQSEPPDLNKNQKARLIVDMLTRLVVHYNFWFTKARHRTGFEKTMEVLEKAT